MGGCGSARLVLVFSFVGMETREIPYRGEEMLNIVLKDAVTEIGEVVVTGYQQIEKRQLTSAVSTIKTEDLNMVGLPVSKICYRDNWQACR